jgi:acyl-CoA thioesterase II
LPRAAGEWCFPSASIGGSYGPNLWLDMMPLADLWIFSTSSRSRSISTAAAIAILGLAAFGGQVLAQALVAARRTVDEPREAHSLHGYFILPGDLAAPIVYFVDRLRDGSSFSTRQVSAIQHGRAIFTLSA